MAKHLQIFFVKLILITINKLWKYMCFRFDNDSVSKKSENGTINSTVAFKPYDSNNLTNIFPSVVLNSISTENSIIAEQDRHSHSHAHSRCIDRNGSNVALAAQSNSLNNNNSTSTIHKNDFEVEVKTSLDTDLVVHERIV